MPRATALRSGTDNLCHVTWEECETGMGCAKRLNPRTCHPKFPRLYLKARQVVSAHLCSSDRANNCSSFSGMQSTISIAPQMCPVPETITATHSRLRHAVPRSSRVLDPFSNSLAHFSRTYRPHAI